MQILEFLKALIYGAVEGITEWLPVSSTGHMLILERFLPFKDVSEGFWPMFTVVIQFGAILAAVLTLWRKIWPLARREDGSVRVRMPVVMLWLKVVVACLPLPVIKVLDLDELIPSDSLLAIALALIVVGALFIVVENLRAGKRPKVRSMYKITFAQAFVIGLCQAVAAVFPGTSRSGATIIGALLMGISRRAGIEFTFTMAIPVMLGAGLMDLLDFGFAFAGSELALLLIGVAVAFVVSMLVIRPLLNYLKRHTFKIFGAYRIALGLIVIIWVLITGAR